MQAMQLVYSVLTNQRFVQFVQIQNINQNSEHCKCFSTHVISAYEVIAKFVQVNVVCQILVDM